MRDVTVDGGGVYTAVGDPESAQQEYERFRGCIAQLLDDASIVGDVEGRWVVFKDGWVYGMATYPSKRDAVVFGRQMFRDEPEATYIVVQVDVDAHNINAMEVLASSISDAEGFDVSTAPDEIRRTKEDADS